MAIRVSHSWIKFVNPEWISLDESRMLVVLSHMSRVIANCVLKFPNFRYRRNKDRCMINLYYVIHSGFFSWILHHFPEFFNFTTSRQGANWHFVLYLSKLWTGFVWRDGAQESIDYILDGFWITIRTLSHGSESGSGYRIFNGFWWNFWRVKRDPKNNRLDFGGVPQGFWILIITNGIREFLNDSLSTIAINAISLE